MVKAYTTRVGSGPFPMELPEGDEVGDLLVDRGVEFGTNTEAPPPHRLARPRDAAACGRGSTRAPSSRSPSSTSCRRSPSCKVCVGYEGDDGTLYEHVPYHQSVLHKVRPVYETLPGWQTEIERAERIDDLPRPARDYVDFIERFAGVPISFVSVGPARDQTVVLPRAA